jgi:bilin biosynthesis protein
MTQDELYQQLKHPNPHLRDRAMVQIVEERTAETLPKMMAILDDEDVVYRRAVVKALGMVGLEAVPYLVEGLLKSDNVTVRGSCAKALAQVALNYPEKPFPSEGLQGLKTALSDENPVVYIGSAMALGEIGSPAFDILTESLKTTEDLGLAVSLVNALCATKDPKAIDALTALTTDESIDSYVRETAVSALSRLNLTSTYRRSDAG